MMDEFEEVGGAEVEEMPFHDMMELFDELTFKEKWTKVFAGLKMPAETGEYKFAKLQMVRLSAPVAAFMVPLLVLVLISVMANFAKPESRTYTVQQMDPKPPEELPDPPEIEPPDPPEPVEVDFKPDAPVTPSDNVSPPNEYSPQPAEFDSVAMIKSPVIMRGIYGSRNPGARGTALAAYGGSGEGEIAVMRALRWLKKNQGKDGSWGADRCAMTSEALLAYLAHGETPDSLEFGDTVYKAIQFIISCESGGRIKKYSDGHEYTLPIAAYALSETYTMTDNPEVQEVAQRLIKTIIKGQNAVGGFNYNLKGPSDTRNDMSYLAWCVQALKAARVAKVMTEEELHDSLEKAVKGVKANYGSKGDYGGFGYASKGATGLTGAGILCLQFLHHAQDKEVQSALALTENAVCSWDMSKVDAMHKRFPLYYWYYLTQAKFQQGGTTWQSWNKQFSPTLVHNQTVVGKEASGYVDHEGNPQEIGFWTPPPGGEGHGPKNNPTFSTALCTLMLEVYYRYLPTFKVPQGVMDEPAGGGGDIEDEDDDLDIQISLAPAAWQHG